jgi:TonB-linked SusC/RagA family outer membrane protein
MNKSLRLLPRLAVSGGLVLAATIASLNPTLRAQVQTGIAESSAAIAPAPMIATPVMQPSASATLELVQTAQVSGTVVDETGAPVRGVIIRIKGSNKGAVSDKDGKYTIAAAPNDILVFNLVGYTKKEVSVGDKANINVTMSLDMQKLEDVIVVGYGSQSKRDLTGNVVKVKAADIADMPVPTFDQALQGKAAGVLITAGSGKVGGGVQIRVRGQSSVSASNEPLFVVDGIPISTSFGNFNAEGLARPISTNPLADINPQDIESIDILKDASSAAIYGSRGANGVVLITTKKGKLGTTKVNVGFQRGFSEAGRRLDFLNAQQYEQLYRQAAANSDRIDGLMASDPDSYTAYMEEYFRAQSQGLFGTPRAANTNWTNAVLRTAPTTQADFSISGGNEKTNFFASGQYLEQEGILIGNKLGRFTGRLNIEHKVSEIFKTGFNVTVSRTLNQRLSGDRQFDNPLQAVALPPITPLLDTATGLPIGTPPGDVSLPAYYNPLINLGNVKRDLTVLRNIGNIFAELQILEGLIFRTQFGFDFSSQQEERYFNSKTARNYGAPLGLAETLGARTENFNITSYLNFNRVIDVHTIDAVAGMEYQRSQTIDNFTQVREFPSDAFRTLTTGARKTDGRSNQQDFSFVSYFARANYKLLDKYLFSANARIDGSSRFGINNRYGFFPAVSAGWVISQEDFLKDNSAVSFLKMRVGYGRTGNAEGIGNYAPLALFAGDAAYAGNPGQRPAQLPNPDLTWETTDQFDAGFDFGFVDNRITGEIAVYNKQTTGLLLNVNVPNTTGFDRQFRNVGGMRNWGVEFVLNTENVVTEDFTWRTNFNIAWNNNTVTNLGGQIIEGGLNNMSRAVEGQPIGTFFTPEYAGVNPNNGDALWFRDSARADGSIARVTTNRYNSANRVVVGSALPLFVGGITNTITFQGLELSFLFSGQFGNRINFFGVGRFSSANARFEDNQTVDQLQAWTPNNRNTNIPEARLFFNNGAQPSSRFIYDGSFVRLRNVTLAYNLPKSLLESIKVNSVRVFVTGQNLLLFTNYRGWDPEVNADDIVDNVAQGYDFYTAPQPRIITFGINVGF